MWQKRLGAGVTSHKGVLVSEEVLAEDKDTEEFTNGNKNASNQVQPQLHFHNSFITLRNEGKGEKKFL